MEAKAERPRDDIKLTVTFLTDSHAKEIPHLLPMKCHSEPRILKHSFAATLYESNSCVAQWRRQNSMVMSSQIH